MRVTLLSSPQIVGPHRRKSLLHLPSNRSMESANLHYNKLQTKLIQIAADPVSALCYFADIPGISDKYEVFWVVNFKTQVLKFSYGNKLNLKLETFVSCVRYLKDFREESSNLLPISSN
jgi:hypothetical protein